MRHSLLGMAAITIGSLVAVGAMGSGGGGGGRIAEGIVGETPGGLAAERLALTVGGGYAVAKGGAKAIEKCAEKGGRICFTRNGGGGGGGAVEDNAKGRRDENRAAPTPTTEPPPKAPEAPPPTQPPAPPSPQPTMPPAPETNMLGRSDLFGGEGQRRPGDRGQITPPNAQPDLMLPIPQGMLR